MSIRFVVVLLTLSVGMGLPALADDLGDAEGPQPGPSLRSGSAQPARYPPQRPGGGYCPGGGRDR
jgi:hypothetical protein